MITQPLLAVAAELDKIKYPVLATPKLDGIRCVKVNGKPLTRKFKSIPNKYICSELAENLPDGFDGEIMLANPKATFQEISSAVMSHDGTPQFKFWAFDYVTDSLTEPYHRRVKKMLDYMEEADRHDQWDNRIQILVPKLIKSREALDKYEAMCLEQGHEGIMVRDPHGRYKCGRSTLKEGILLKVKRFEDSEAEILGFEERLKNTNTQEVNELGYAKRSSAKAGMVGAGTLGAFLVRDVKTGKEFSVGSGLDDAMRAKIWSDKASYKGMLIRYKYQPTGIKEETGIPRFPIFQGFRHVDDL